jgi:hypothetical protein
MTIILSLIAVGILILLMIAHWPASMWEPRNAVIEEEDEPVYFREEYAETECGAWFFKGYDGQEWGPFRSEAIARVNHRNYLSVVEQDIHG